MKMVSNFQLLVFAKSCHNFAIFLFVTCLDIIKWSFETFKYTFQILDLKKEVSQ